MALGQTPLPEHYRKDQADAIWKVDYQKLADSAVEWAKNNRITPAHSDQIRTCLLLVDCQNSFCTPGFELFVGGRSGNAAVEDSIRITEFIYHNPERISNISLSMDTHFPVQIFHSIFLIDSHGRHPDPMTLISAKDIEDGKWRVNPEITEDFTDDTYERLQKYLMHYCRRLEKSDKYQLMVWPYHAMLGGIGHTLVSLIEEAVFFHSIARSSQPHFEIKGENMLTENYSIFRPEVGFNQEGKNIALENRYFFDHILSYDRIIIAGQAKSHCVAWTVQDLLAEIKWRDPGLIERIYILEDCTSTVVVPGVIDFTDQTEKLFREFAKAGIHLVKSTTDMAVWPKMAV